MLTTRMLVPSLLGLFVTWGSLAAADVKLAIHLAEQKPAEGCVEATLPNTKQKIYLHPQAALTEKDVAKAGVTTTTQGFPAILVSFTKEGGEKMAKLTEANQGKMLAVLVNGKVISAPTIRSKIADKAVITGQFTKTEADKIAEGINRK